MELVRGGEGAEETGKVGAEQGERGDAVVGLSKGRRVREEGARGREKRRGLTRKS